MKFLKTLSLKNRRQFSDLVNHQTDRLRSGSDTSLPSQLLFAIIRSSQLAPFLSPVQRRAIDILMKHERKRIEDIAAKESHRATP